MASAEANPILRVFVPTLADAFFVPTRFRAGACRRHSGRARGASARAASGAGTADRGRRRRRRSPRPGSPPVCVRDHTHTFTHGLAHEHTHLHTDSRTNTHIFTPGLARKHTHLHLNSRAPSACVSASGRRLARARMFTRLQGKSEMGPPPGVPKIVGPYIVSCVYRSVHYKLRPQNLESVHYTLR